MNQTCHDCLHLSTRHHELDPIGEWKWCELYGREVLEDSHWCPDYRQTRWNIEGRKNMVTRCRGFEQIERKGSNETP